MKKIIETINKDKNLESINTRMKNLEKEVYQLKGKYNVLMDFLYNKYHVGQLQLLINNIGEHDTKNKQQELNTLMQENQH